MKRLFKHKVLALALLVALTFAAVNCGILLHPERKGHKGGSIDGPVLVMDCLWLIAGVVPGVVALVVDFTTGGMYKSGTAMNTAPGQAFTFRLRGEAPRKAEVAVTIQGRDGRVVSLLDRNLTQGEIISDMQFALPADLAPGDYSLAMSVNHNPNAEWTLHVASAQE
jgi:hypothetical protein